MAANPIDVAGRILGILGESFRIRENRQSVQNAATESQKSFRADVEEFQIVCELMEAVWGRWGRQHFNEDLRWRIVGVRGDSARQLEIIQLRLQDFARTDSEDFNRDLIAQRPVLRRDRRNFRPLTTLTREDVAIRNQAARRAQFFAGDAMTRNLLRLRIYKQTLKLWLAITRASYGNLPTEHQQNVQAAAEGALEELQILIAAGNSIPQIGFLDELPDVGDLITHLRQRWIVGLIGLSPAAGYQREEDSETLQRERVLIEQIAGLQNQVAVLGQQVRQEQAARVRQFDETRDLLVAADQNIANVREAHARTNRHHRAENQLLREQGRDLAQARDLFYQQRQQLANNNRQLEEDLRIAQAQAEQDAARIAELEQENRNLTVENARLTREYAQVAAENDNLQADRGRLRGLAVNYRDRARAALNAQQIAQENEANARAAQQTTTQRFQAEVNRRREVQADNAQIQNNANRVGHQNRRLSADNEQLQRDNREQRHLKHEHERAARDFQRHNARLRADNRVLVDQLADERRRVQRRDREIRRRK
ncbi:hypothetical protein BT63DRAFT_457344 [Microthyrium microscopicum]|uniref:Uncharacterized protein n=1 Tax=Microthyrium microscopicum TaxID=703497 RepID=A0A6A6UAV7_9PEZI|nr:hypothetical protein BT63DRAFT_457344 [Microthyrium microscopicum]